MSYKLEKPYTDKQRADFVCAYQGLTPYEDETAFYFLEANEMVNGDGEIVINPDYDTEQTAKREAEFKTNFFEINTGWYRRKPKGYSSAIESLNTAFNAVTVLGKLPADTLTFYTAPDFTDAEQCTESWLVENSFKNAEMTATQFGTFYATFLQAWNASEH